MGEETDGVIESVSKLQAKVKGLSGVDILTDTGAYKDTYTIIKEIAQVWDQMNDIDQAALLELLAGKNRSNAMASLLGNLDDLEGAYESAMEAQGSAEAENEKYMNSIQGKIDQLNNAVQTMWNNAIDSDTIKFFVDVAKAIVVTVDKLGLLETAIGGLVAYFKVLKPAFGNKTIWKKVIGEDGTEYFEKIKVKAEETVNTVSGASQDMAQNVAKSQQEAAESVSEASAQETAAKEASTAATVEHTAANEVDSVATTEAATAEQTRASTSQQEATEQTVATEATLANVDANIADTESTLAAANAEKIRASTSQMEAVAQAGATASAGANVVGEVAGGAASSGIISKLVSKIGGKAAGGAAAGGILSSIGGKAATLIPVIGKAILIMGAVNLAVKGVSKVIGLINDKIHEAENLKKEVTALEKDFEQSQKESNENIKKLTTSSNETQYSSLLDEFRQLAKGVDKYGNNIGLTTDQYKRYEEICETICDINPSLASGYDKATKAIGNNASALEQLIELEKLQARENAREYVSDDNLEKIAKNAANDYKDADKEYQNAIKGDSIKDKVKDVYKGLNISGHYKDVVKSLTGKDNITDYIESQDTAVRYLSEHIDEVRDKLQSAYETGKSMPIYTDNGQGQMTAQYISHEQIGNLLNQVDGAYTEYESKLTSAQANLEKKKKALVDTLLQVPASMSEYDNLSTNSQNFIVQWIKNSKMFEIDDNFKAEDALGMKTSIQAFIKDLSNNAYQYTVKESDNIKGLSAGAKIDASTILDQIVDINPSNVDYSQYKSQIQKLIDMLWESLGTSGQALFNNDKDGFALSIGFDFTTKDEDIKNDSELLAKRIGEDAEVIQKKIEQMPASQVDAFVKIDWNDAAPNSWQEVMALINKQVSSVGAPSVDVYSTLADNVSKFNDVTTQTKEIVSDNTTVTQEYKDTVSALGATEEELNECFDEQNPLVVKNAALLRKLVATKRAEQQATVRSAKAMAQLQYRNTIKQLQQLVSKMRDEYKANGLVSSATLKTANILRDQLNAIRQTIKHYSILTLKLSDTADAYNDFEKAKEIDAELTYGDSMVEMLEAINEGFKTGKVGTETFRAAVEALVPDSVYANLENFKDRMIAIHDYIDKNPLFADWFTVDDGEFSITQKNVKAFVEDLQSAGVFTQYDENGNFYLEDGIDSFDKILDKMNKVSDGAGVTKEALMTMFTEASKYDASWGDMLTDLLYPAEAAANQATDALSKAVIAKEEYLKAGGEYNEEGEWVAYNEDRWNELCTAESQATVELNKATSAARTNADQWVSLQALYKSATGEMTLTADQADRLARELGLVDENGNAITLTVDDNGSIQLTAEQVDILNKKKAGLSEPSILSVQTDYDQICGQIDELQNYIDNKLNPKESRDIEAKYNIQNQAQAKDMIEDVLNPQKNTIELEYGITKTSEEQQSGTIEKLQNWETNGIQFDVSANVDEESTNEVKETEKELEKDINPLVLPQVDKEFQKTAEKILDDLAKDRTSTIYVNTVETNSSNNTGGGYGPIKHFDGTANASGNWGLPQAEHNSLVGELGMETVVDPHTGHYYTVGNHGAELVDLPKDAIIFNHLQTEELFKNGHINSRGQAYASGNAHYGLFDGYTGFENVFRNGSDKWVDAWDKNMGVLSDAADSISDAADEFEEVFDWFEVLLEEIEDNISLMNAKLENAIGISAKKGIYSEIINTEQFKLQELYEGIQLYSDYANKLLAKVPDQYKEMAKNGAVAITDFLGEANEEVVESINNYREWAKKVTDLNQQLEETKKNIADTHVEIQSMIKDEYDNRISLITSVNDRIQETIDLLDEEGKRSSAVMYEEMIKNSTKQLSELQNKRAEMQKALDEAVRLGENGGVIKYSTQWYEMVNAIGDVDSEINDCKIDLEGFQNSINQLHWDNFEKLIDAIDNVGTEISNLGDLIDEEDVVDDIGNWTNKGITALGLYAQEMERVKYRAEQYGKEIEYLNEQYAAGKYSTDEYNEKLQELRDGQWDSIKSYESAKKAIIDLNKTRVEAIKDGIEKEIDAYSELIDKKKEELSLQKDAHDFSKQVAESQKNIANLQKQLAVMSGDNSAAANAQKKKLQAQLAEAQEELDELYYSHSVEKQQEALDKSLENYQDNKQDEMDALDESLKNEEQIIADSFATITANTESVAQTLSEIASKYGITLSDSVMQPWLDGANATGTYQEKLDTSMSSFTQQLETIKKMFADLQSQADSTGKSMVDAINSSKSSTESATYTPPAQSQPSTPSTPSKPSAPSAGASVTVKRSATNFSRDGGNGTRMQSWVPGSTFTVYQVSGSEVLIGRNGGYTGWVKLSDIEGYSSGTEKVSSDQLALIDELGEELQLVPGKNGRLEYIKKGTGIIPANLTEKLMNLAIDPTSVLERATPKIDTPYITNNNMEINLNVSEVVHIDNADNHSIPDIAKAVQDQMDTYMKHINQGLKRYTR